MSRSRHDRNAPRNFKRPNREGAQRAQVRSSLATGNYDDLPTRMPTRLFRKDAIS